MNSSDKVLIAEKNDGFNNYRRIYNDIIEEKIIEGRQGIEQERYLTITIERKNFEEAKAQFATLEATIHNPDIGWETADEYLSGNVRDKLRVARAMAADTDNPQAERFAGKVAALEKVQPEWIEASDIDVKIGTTWIEPLDYEQFIYELLNTPRRARAVRSQFYNTGIQVHLNKMSMEGSSRIRAWISIQWQLLRLMVQAAWMLILFLRIR